MKKSDMKQCGFIKLGAGLNARAWIDQAKREGYAVVLCGEYVELWTAGVRT